MPTVDDLLESLAGAARENQKAEFDRLERELLAHYEGGFDGMPEDVYQRYLDVDRHWPIAVDGKGAPSRGRTLEILLPVRDQLWLEELAAATDRSLSAVVSHCLASVRADPETDTKVREALERERQRGD
jgi:hypothetical protein